MNSKWEEEENIFIAFKRNDLIIFTHPEQFKDYLFMKKFDNTSLLLMSSGNYGGLNFDELKELFKLLGSIRPDRVLKLLH